MGKHMTRVAEGRGDEGEKKKGEGEIKGERLDSDCGGAIMGGVIS